MGTDYYWLELVNLKIQNEERNQEILLSNGREKMETRMDTEHEPLNKAKEKE